MGMLPGVVIPCWKLKNCIFSVISEDYSGLKTEDLMKKA